MNIIEEYNAESIIERKNSNLEFEIRFNKIGKIQFVERYKYFSENTHLKPNVIYTLNIINKSASKSSDIRELTFDANKKQVASKFYTKTNIKTVYADTTKIGYNISLSTEDIKEKINISDHSFMRFKNRHEFTLIQGATSWMVDFTIVLTLDSQSVKNAETLRSIINEFYMDTDIDNWVKLSSHYDNLSYEIEIEHKKGVITESIVDEVAASICEKYNNLEILLKNELSTIADVLGANRKNCTIKRLLPQVETLNKDIWREMYPPIGLYMTLKVDGIRSILHYYKKKCLILNDNIKICQLEIKHINQVLLDGELVGSEFLAFDLIKYNDNSFINEQFPNRIAQLPDICNLLSMKQCDFTITAKPYVLLDATYKEQIKNILVTQYKHDGIIFVNPAGNYKETKCYKWKPPAMITIDFMVKKYKSAYYLFVGINYNQYMKLCLSFCEHYDDIFPNIDMENIFPIQFSPASNPYVYYVDYIDLDSCVDQICEFSWDTSNNQWILHRTRDDRKKDVLSGEYFGNNFYVAEMNWLNIIDPFPLEQLLDGCTSDGYFSTEKKDMYMSQVAVNTKMKETLIKKYCANAEWVMDIGTGHGQDLKRYANAKIRNLIVVEKDVQAIVELIRRRHTIFEKLPQGFSINIERYDLNTTPFETILDNICTYNHNQPTADSDYMYSDIIDVCVCNFAAHYFMATEESAHNFINLTKSAKVVIITGFDGRRVYDRLHDFGFGESWSLNEGDIRKYEITKLYKSANFESYGQKISVLHPFSDGKKYEEYLMNWDWIHKQYELDGSTWHMETVHANTYCDEIYNAKLLTKEDREYLELYGGIILTKK